MKHFISLLNKWSHDFVHNFKDIPNLPLHLKVIEKCLNHVTILWQKLGLSWAAPHSEWIDYMSKKNFDKENIIWKWNHYYFLDKLKSHRYDHKETLIQNNLPSTKKKDVTEMIQSILNIIQSRSSFILGEDFFSLGIYRFSKRLA